MPAVLLIPLFFAAMNFLTSGGLNLASRQIDSNPNNNPSFAEWLPILAATGIGAAAPAIGGAVGGVAGDLAGQVIGKTAGSVLGSAAGASTYLGTENLLPLEARQISSQFNTSQYNPPSTNTSQVNRIGTVSSPYSLYTNGTTNQGSQGTTGAYPVSSGSGLSPVPPLPVSSSSQPTIRSNVGTSNDFGSFIQQRSQLGN